MDNKMEIKANWTEPSRKETVTELRSWIMPHLS